MTFRMVFLFWIKYQNALNQFLSSSSFCCCYNYRSALSNQSQEENQIKTVINNGNYVITKIKPFIVLNLN